MNSKNSKDISSSYDTILKESAALVTFSGILFGFILNISINPPDTFSYMDKILLLITLYAITIAACLFVMPIIYHHLQYPYHDFEKFRKRSHRFILYGLIPVGITLIIALGISSSLLINKSIFIPLSLIPFILIIVLYLKRK
ncbi:MAG TPA: DUF6328 family protein [Nitrososphaeraceae archaeon]|jgi:hypothetical protein